MKQFLINLVTGDTITLECETDAAAKHMFDSIVTTVNDALSKKELALIQH